MNRLRKLWTRAREIQHDGGLIALSKAGSSFFISPIYKQDYYYLYENDVRKDYMSSESQPRLNSNDLTFKVVSSSQAADELEAENFKFRSYPTDWNHGITDYRLWLNQGAIAFCTFVGKEFAAITWVIPSQQVQDRITYPQKIDYSNEIFTRGSWVNPKYRGKELYRYTVRNRDRFLAERGVKLTRTNVVYGNKVGKGVLDQMGARMYGRGRLIRILWWYFWTETPERERTKM